MRYCTACGADSGMNGTAGGSRRDGSVNYEQILDAEDYTASFDPADIRDNKIYAVLAYLGSKKGYATTLEGGEEIAVRQIPYRTGLSVVYPRRGQGNCI